MRQEPGPGYPGEVLERRGADRRRPPGDGPYGTPRSVTRLPVDRLADQIGVPVVSRVLLDHVHQDPP
jgi:hypothetical protein